jgi:hypothetical protein
MPKDAIYSHTWEPSRRSLEISERIYEETLNREYDEYLEDERPRKKVKYTTKWYDY